MGYAEWGTRLAVQNSPGPGADVVEQAPVPALGLGRRAPCTRRARFPR